MRIFMNGAIGRNLTARLGYDKVMEGQCWDAKERFKLQSLASKQVEKAKKEKQEAYKRALEM